MLAVNKALNCPLDLTNGNVRFYVFQVFAYKRKLLKEVLFLCNLHEPTLAESETAASFYPSIYGEAIRALIIIAVNYFHKIQSR